MMLEDINGIRKQGSIYITDGSSGLMKSHFRYGITCMLIPFAAILCYIQYAKATFFPLALLALNGANSIMFVLLRSFFLLASVSNSSCSFTEVIYEDVPTFKDTPAVRAGKQLVSYNRAFARGQNLLIQLICRFPCALHCQWPLLFNI